MVHEALLSGLQVIYNGQEVKEVPPEREPSQFASTVKSILENLC
jgi:hypothetical protein